MSCIHVKRHYFLQLRCPLKICFALSKSNSASGTPSNATFIRFSKICSDSLFLRPVLILFWQGKPLTWSTRHRNYQCNIGKSCESWKLFTKSFIIKEPFYELVHVHKTVSVKNKLELEVVCSCDICCHANSFSHLSKNWLCLPPFSRFIAKIVTGTCTRAAQ